MSLISHFEEEYGNVVAKITSQISKLAIEANGNREIRKEIEKDFSEAQELLEQMSLTIHDETPSNKSSRRHKLECYKAEMKRLELEYRNSKQKTSNSDFEDDYVDLSIKDDQKQRLLNNSERIERTGRTLADGYRIVLETEQIGSQVLQDLNHQRETILGAKNKLHETNAELSRARRVLNSIIFRSHKEKFVLYGVATIFVVVVCLSVYLSLAN